MLVANSIEVRPHDRPYLNSFWQDRSDRPAFWTKMVHYPALIISKQKMEAALKNIKQQGECP